VTRLTTSYRLNFKSTSTPRRAPFRSRAYLNSRCGPNLQVVNETFDAQPGGVQAIVPVLPPANKSLRQPAVNIKWAVATNTPNAHRLQLHHAPLRLALTQTLSCVTSQCWCLMPTPTLKRLATERALASRTRFRSRASAAFCPGHLLDEADLVLLTTYSGEQQHSPSPESPAFWICGALANAFAGCAFNSC